MTPDDYNRKLAKLLQEEYDSFVQKGMKGWSKRGWIYERNEGGAWISVFFSTKRLNLKPNIDRIPVKDLAKLPAFVEGLKRGILAGQLNDEIKAASAVRIAAAMNRRRNEQSQEAAA